MADMTNGSRSTKRKPSQNKKQTGAKSTRRFEPSNCDERCGTCWFTDCGEIRCCEAEHLGSLRRELTDALAGVTR